MNEPSEAVRLTVASEETGEVRIGPIPSSPAGTATVPIPGGTVYVDPASPDAPPTAVVADPDKAAPALEQIYGEQGVDAVTAAEQPASVPVVATDAAVRVTRLGILRWLRSINPFAPDQGLLTLETAVATMACGDVLAADDETTPTLEDLGDAIVALAWAAREGGTESMPAGLTDLLEVALNGLVLNLAPDDPLADSVRHESELRDAMSALSIDRMDWGRWEELVRQVRPVAATRAGPPDGSAPDTVGGTASVDWTRVPAGLLDPGEGTVDWLAYPVDRERFRVEVSVRARDERAGEFRLADWLDRTDKAAAAELRRLSGRAGTPELRFRLYTSGFGLPIAAGTMSRSADGALWHGSAEISERALREGELFVDIHSEGARGPRRDRAVAAEASRWAVRGLGLLRLSLAGTAAVHDVRGPLERARQLYETAADRAGDPDASRRLRRSLARCEALLAAHLIRMGERRMAERLEVRTARAALDAGDTKVPDLGHPLWSPTVTERALLQGPGADG